MFTALSTENVITHSYLYLLTVTWSIFFYAHVEFTSHTVCALVVYSRSSQQMQPAFMYMPLIDWDFWSQVCSDRTMFPDVKPLLYIFNQ